MLSLATINSKGFNFLKLKIYTSYVTSEILTPHVGVKSARAYMYCMSYLLIIPYQHYLFCQCPSKNVGVHILHFDGFLFEILVKLKLVTKVKTSKKG